MGRPESSPISPVGSARAAINHKRNLAKEASPGKDAAVPQREMSASTTCGDSRASTPVADFVAMPLDLTLPEYAFAASKASNVELQAAIAGLTAPVHQKLLQALDSKTLAANAGEVVPSIDAFARQIGATGLSDLAAALDGVCANNKKKLADAIGQSDQVVESVGIMKYIASAKTSSESDVRAAVDGLAAAQRKKIGDILADMDSKVGAKESAGTAADAFASKFVTRFIVAAVNGSSMNEMKAVLAAVPREQLSKLYEVVDRPRPL